jgi:FixJ family two-component response regulator
MPGLSGAQLAATVRRLKPWIGIVLLTGYGSLMTEADRPGAVDVVLGKPMTARALQDAVLRAREIARAREALR